MDTDEFLEHYGVKGMKWGQTKFSKSEIKTGRKNMKETFSRIQELDKDLDAAIRTGDKTKAKQALKKQMDLARESNMTKDARASYQMTAGEKFAKVVFTGAVPTYGSIMDKRSRSDKEWSKVLEDAESKLNTYENTRIGEISKIKK